MPSTNGTVRALAEQLAQDDDLRARLANEPRAVLEEWGIPAGADVVPGTVTLPSAAELAGLVTASSGEEPEEPEIHLGERAPEIHLPAPEIHLGEPAPEIHLPEEPEIHLGEPEIHLGEPAPEIHLPEEPEIHLGEPEIHLGEPEIHLAEVELDDEDEEDD